MQKIKMLTVWMVVLYIIVCALMYFKQRSLLFFPVPEVINNSEVRFFSVDGERIKVWQIHADKNNAIIYFGGNAENVAHNIQTYSHLFPEHAVYFVNYRGYAGSSGFPSEQALFTDALAIFDEISTKHQQVSAVGRSLGSGVAVHLAVSRPVNKLVLVTAYDSIASVAQKKYFWLPVSLLIKDRFDSVSKAPKIVIPTLVLSSEYDRVIPFRHTKALMKAFDNRLLQAKIIKGTSHNTIEQGQDYYPILQAFLSMPSDAEKH